MLAAAELPRCCFRCLSPLCSGDRCNEIFIQRSNDSLLQNGRNGKQQQQQQENPCTGKQARTNKCRAVEKQISHAPDDRTVARGSKCSIVSRVLHPARTQTIDLLCCCPFNFYSFPSRCVVLPGIVLLLSGVISLVL